MQDNVHTRLFDRALQLRDAGKLEEAVALLQELVAARASTDQRLHAHALLQLGHVLGKLDRHAEAVAAFRAATDTTPRMELASLALFTALDKIREPVDALCEAFRFVSLRESLAYREVFCGDAFRDEASEEFEIAEQARAMLAAHRDAQRRRAQPMPGDTVRIRATAPAALHPGRLAMIRGLKRQTAHLEFSDGERAEADIALLDHHDV
jgi:tetratricopeptide (TPR) repeat protein